ncbi:MAG: helix-turn-helix transcriptional regulator [Candidatus Aminicenantes bacterium]|nr:helix-turn-helix transcriptional regulator [Candidatus Aminicenantes bacterium]
MERALLISSRRETEELIKETFGRRISLSIIQDVEESELDDSFCLIMAECDYNCNLDKCLKKFLFIFNHRSVSAVLLKPVVTRDRSSNPGFFLRILNNIESKAVQKDVLSWLKDSEYHFGSGNMSFSAFNPEQKIIQVEKSIVEEGKKLSRLEDLAKISGWSLAWLSANFHKFSGILFRTFRARERCCYALWELVSTNKPIKTIAIQAGYEPLYFSSLFKRFFRIPPSSLRSLIGSGQALT